MTVRAADLPEGSIVALGPWVVMRNPDGFTPLWWGNTGPFDHETVDEGFRRGAKVLRHGYGEEA